MINPPSTNFAEQWIKQYVQQNSAVSYKAFDYDGIKRSLIEYLRTFHPEYFNNLIETDELLPLIELFAYVGELYAYRADVNTQEHILSATTRKSSAIQIANMLGYTPSRRTPGMGLVKITSISTTESIVDTDGSNLQRRVIRWNDQTNPRWRAQFDAVLMRTLNSSTGVSLDADKTQVENIVFERYVMNTKPIQNGVFKYTIKVNGVTTPMEIVGTQLTENSITELPPTGDRPLDILYANDGFGDSSPGSGYMFLTKQGTLSSAFLQFDGGVANLTQPINATGINDTDIWLNAVDTNSDFIKSWSVVDNIAYNSNSSRDVYQVTSREDDSVLLVFGDGNYASKPKGRFQVWYRTSLELDSTIPTSAVETQTLTMDYLDMYGNLQTVTYTFSLQSPIISSSASETLDKLKQSVPGVFYTQDRMVNAQDHQNYLLQDPSIVKIKAVNRTFAGHSKYSGWYESSELYENVKIFSDDGILFLDSTSRLNEVINTNQTISYVEFVSTHLSRILQYPDLWAAITLTIHKQPQVRTFFTPTEQTMIVGLLQLLIPGSTLVLEWRPAETIAGVTNPEGWYHQTIPSPEPDRHVTITLHPTSAGWSIEFQSCKTVLQSPSTRFWQYSSISGIDYDTVNPTQDLITILKANPNKSRTGLMQVDTPFIISNNLQLDIVLPHQASLDLSKVELINANTTVEQSTGLSTLLNAEIDVSPFSPTDPSPVIQLPYPIIAGVGITDIISVTGYVGAVPTILTVEPYTLQTPTQTIRISGPVNVQFDRVVITIQDWVYFSRVDESSQFTHVPYTAAVLQGFINGDANLIRKPGRDGLNFLWQHFTSEFEIINPARTNITDIYLITKQYYTDYIRWMGDNTYTKPSIPTATQLSIAYSKYMRNAMMSDELVLRPGKFKPLFGPASEPTLRATIQVVLSTTLQSSKDSIKQEIVNLVKRYFDISNTEFGDTFYFSNLSSYIHTNCKYPLGSVLLIPLYPGYQFGDLYELTAAPDEVFVADISITDIQIVDQITSTNIRQ